MDDENECFGARVTRLRKKAKLSQTQLGEFVDASQAWVSRLESQDSPSGDTKMISLLSKGLGISVTTLLEGYALPPGFLDEQEQPFFAFCANPFCSRNKTSRAGDGTARISWSSGKAHAGESYEEVNFCGGCGTALVKACPSCARRLKEAGIRFCITCGTQVNSRPTKAEWEKLEETIPKDPPPSEEDDIPF